MIEYHFRVSSATVFTLYSYSKALEYRFKVPTAGSLKIRLRAWTSVARRRPSRDHSVVPPKLLNLALSKKKIFRYIKFTVYA
jgi:hypothetical protein